MARILTIVSLLSLLTQTVIADEHAAASTFDNQSALRITSVGKDVPDVLGRLFSKQIDVHGIRVLATKGTPEEKTLHAANVMAQYLDNDADGMPDNPRVIRSMRESKATLLMFASADESERVIEELEESSTDQIDAMILQDLYGEETHPGGASRGLFDAAYEEVLHLITHAGYALAYPEVFGERPGSKLADAMDKARGGRFLMVPNKYPRTSWYTYDDDTCDYACQATEYIYWGLTSLLGAQDFPGRAAEIADEWRLNTAEKFKVGDPLLYNLLTDKRYKLPTRLPDGKYRPKRK